MDTTKTQKSNTSKLAESSVNQGANAQMAGASEVKSEVQKTAGLGRCVEQVQVLLTIARGGSASASELQAVGLESSYSQEGAMKKAAEILATASKADKSAIADIDTMCAIMSLPASADRNKLLDSLVEGVTTPDIVSRMINARFGVRLLASDMDTFDESSVYNYVGFNETINTEWTANGLRRVYETYKNLPQADLDLIRYVFSKSNHNNGGAADGKAGVYYIDYNKDQEDTEVENGQYTDKDAKVPDARLGMNSMDMTTAHELGHIVDASVSPTYSQSEEFMKVSGWKRHSRSNVIQLVQDIYECVKDPVPTNLADKYNKLAPALVKEAAVCIVEGVVNIRSMQDLEAQKNAYMWLPYQSMFNAFKSVGLKPEQYNTETGAPIYSQEACQIGDILLQSNFIKHLFRAFADLTPWYAGELFPELPNRQIHEGYSGQDWYSYDNKAWEEGKISKYQFRDPGEEFAETYALYHVSKRTGEQKTPRKLRDWFEKQGLDKVDRAGQPAPLKTDAKKS